MIPVLCILQLMLYMACGCIVDERIALMRIRSLLVEANSTNVRAAAELQPDFPASSWGRSEDCCSWNGVRCNNSTRVSILSLYTMFSPPPNSEHEGQAISEIGCGWDLNLTIFSLFHDLEELDLSWNYACVTNADGLDGLTKLRYLNLALNRLTGNNMLESLSKLASLESIHLDSSSMSGALQNTDFRTLKNLRELSLRNNQLNGNIPASLFELPLLEYLDLSENLLQGHLPKSLSAYLPSLLPTLRTLKLSGNNLNGTFDFFWLWNHTTLKHIDLSGNANLAILVNFRGRMPLLQLKALILSGCNLDNSIIARQNFLGTQRHLQFLDLSKNNMAGSLPSWMFTNETTLVYLNLANNLLEGSLDLMSQYQPNLKVINISMNRFVGQLPTDINSIFPNLAVLDASYNNISGHLQPSMCNISGLGFLDLSNNKITGEVPICLFTDLWAWGILKLSNNNLEGPILGGASNLSTVASAIHLDGNYFEGALPKNLSGNQLQVMDLHDNKLCSELDASFWNLSWLEVLNVASSNLTGHVYPAICNLTRLKILDISDNNFAGFIPNCDSNLTLRFLNISSNNLSGFPSGFFSSSHVEVLDVRYNQFKGSVDWIQHLSQIKMLLLGWNKFEGKISENICDLQYMNIVDLSHNKLSGFLPPCIGGISFGYLVDDLKVWSTLYGGGFAIGSLDYHDLPLFGFNSQYDLQGFTFSTKGNLYTYGRCFFDLMSGIDLSSNMLSGDIPWELGNLSHVKALNLSHNFFTGQIPATLANMSAIESLDLSQNKLSGPIPWQLTQLWSLEVFSVACNNLSGCIPGSGQFSTFSLDSYQGNVNLHNSSVCSSVPGPVEEEDVVGAAPEDPILYMVSAGSFVLALWATVAFMFCHSFGQRVVLRL